MSNLCKKVTINSCEFFQLRLQTLGKWQAIISKVIFLDNMYEITNLQVKTIRIILITGILNN